jgi:hypothetical protein
MNYPIEVVPASKNAWFTPAESNNYYRARYAREGVTIHWWGGGEQEDKHDSIVKYIQGQAAAGVKSVNYVVSDAKITQMVDPDNVAWCSNGGNPTTISIECEPGLSDEGYKRLAWLISTLQVKYGHQMNIYRHSDWFPTACPGTIDIERIKREKDGAPAGSLPSTPTPSTNVPQSPVVSSTAQTVYLPSYVDTWAAYKVGSAYRKGTSDQVGTLLPSKFGGLTYPIVERRDNVVVIDTQDFGRVAIWVQGTEAVIRGTGNYVAPTPPQTRVTQTVTFPASVDSWAVYKVDSGYRKNTSDQVGSLLPKTFGGLTYPIVENKGNVVVIDTQNFGRVAAWVQNTDAIIK